MLRSQRSLTDKIAAIFKRTAADVAQQAAEYFAERHPSMQKSDDDFWTTVDLSMLDLIAEQAQHDIKTVAKDSGKQSLIQLNISDHQITGVVDQASADYARERAAEMVGKKWVNGKLVDNPNAEWVITDSTREELRSLITDVTEGELDMTDLRRAIMDSTAFSKERAEMISRTEIMAANGEGSLASYKAAKENGVKIKKAWLADAEACELCQANQDAGAIEVEDAFPSGDITPPLHPNCFVEGTKVLALGVSKAYKRWFEGEVIIIGLPGNNEITVTPNHPILTNRGWVAAKDIVISDRLAQFSAKDGFSLFIDPNYNYVDSLIEDVAGSLLMTGGCSTASVPLSPEDFHGDAVVDQKVDIVYSASDLTLKRKTDFSEECADASFGIGHAGGIVLASKSSLASFLERNLSPSNSIMGGGNAFDSSGITSTSGLNSMSLAMRANDKPVSSESLIKGTWGDTNVFSENGRSFASQISFVEITNLSRRQFSGHVYNLQTADGWYIANSLIVSNCECSLIPEVEYDDD